MKNSYIELDTSPERQLFNHILFNKVLDHVLSKISQPVDVLVNGLTAECYMNIPIDQLKIHSWSIMEEINDLD